MRIITKICDRCKRETSWLYQMPAFGITGLNIKFDTRESAQRELCKKCAQEAIEKYRAACRAEGGEQR